MFAKIKELFFGKPAPVSTEAPYKVEAPAPEVKIEIKSDGGTWPFPVVETTVQPEKPVAKVAKVTKAKKAPAKKPSAAKAAAKPRAKKSAK